MSLNEISSEFVLTALGVVFGVVMFFLSSHRAGKPYDEMKPKRVPWGFLIVLSAFWTVLMLVHLANLWGLETGPDKSPFMRF